MNSGLQSVGGPGTSATQQQRMMHVISRTMYTTTFAPIVPKTETPYPNPNPKI